MYSSLTSHLAASTTGAQSHTSLIDESGLPCLQNAHFFRASSRSVRRNHRISVANIDPKAGGSCRADSQFTATSNLDGAAAELLSDTDSTLDLVPTLPQAWIASR
jgi:hypothetical protein